MESLTRFFAYLPRGGSPPSLPVRDSLRRAAARDNLEVLVEDPYFFAGAPAKSEELSSTARLFADVFPGTAAARSRMATVPNVWEPADWRGLHDILEQQAQAYNLIEAGADGIRIESDRLGIKPFYLAEADGGTVIASTILSILRAFPGLTKPLDHTALYELMIFRAPMRDRTLHKSVRRASVGGCYRWTPEKGLALCHDRRVQPAPVGNLLLAEPAMDEINNAIVASIRQKVGSTSEAVPIALSGGFDSRLLAAATVKAGIPVKLFSFGNRHHPELRRAKAVAEALDQPLEVIPYPADNSIKRLPLHLEALEGTADLATASVANLLEVDLETGAPMIHGFCGDPLAGNHINHITPSEYSDRDGLAGGIMRFYGAAGEHTPERLLSTGVSRQALCDEIRSDLLEGCPLYQSYSAWDFENRQRRYVGSYFAMTGRRFHTIMPFYDPAIFNLWFSIPPIALHGRTLFRSMLARHYPSLARIPHSEESAPIVPNLRHQLADFLRRAPQSMARKLFGEKTAKYLLLLRHRDPYIWSLGNLAAPQQRRYMRTEIDRLGPAMDDVLGLRLADVKVEHLQDHVQALRGLFLTASYAGWLRDRL